MTAYNRESYIAAAIQSVLDSTFTEFELLVVDDRSEDHTVEIAHEFAGRDRRVEVFQNEANLGDYCNRNRAAALAAGKYIKYVDSDDVIYPHGLQVMVDCMEVYPEAALGLSRPPLTSGPFPACLSPNEAYVEHFLGGGLLTNAPLSTILRRSCFENVGGFSGARFCGDSELWLRLARAYSVVMMPMGLAWWREHSVQEQHEEAANPYSPFMRFEVERSALHHVDCPLNSVQKGAALRRIQRNYARTIISMFRHGQFVKGWCSLKPFFSVLSGARCVQTELTKIEGF